MDNFKNSNDIKIHKINLLAIGYHLQFDLILSLTKEQYKDNNINFNKINNLEYIKNKLNENLLLSIKINSNDFLLNTILFINKTNNIKFNIKYIIPFIYKFPQKISFIENIITNILNNEGIFIIPLNLINKTAEINFIFNLIQNNKIIKYKKFQIENNYEYVKNNDLEINNNNINIKKEKNEINKQDYIKIKIIKNVLTKFDFILTCSENINNYIKIFIENKSFEKIIESLEYMKLCIIYDIPIMENFREKIFSVTDIYIFEKNELEKYFKKKEIKNIRDIKDKKNKNNNIKKEEINLIDCFNKQIKQIDHKNYKIEIVIDKLKKINIIQHDSSTQLAVENFEEPIILKDKLSIDNEENLEDIIIANNYNYLKSVYIGTFLGRLFNKKTFNTCLEASILCVKKVIKLIKNNNNQKNNNRNNYYSILVKKLNHPKSVLNLRYTKLEGQFILDGNNICEMNSKKEYNSIYDDNCISFFESKNNRKFLYKQGFINKKGRILMDPDKILKSGDLKNKKIYNLYQNEKINFNKIKLKNDISRKILAKLSRAKEAKIDKNNCNIQTFKELNKQKLEKEYFLPSLNKEKSNLIFGNKLYNKEIKKIKLNSNISKRYFKGFTFNKTIYKSNYSNENKKDKLKNIIFNFNNSCKILLNYRYNMKTDKDRLIKNIYNKSNPYLSEMFLPCTIIKKTKSIL